MSARTDLAALEETVATAIILIQQGRAWPALHLLREAIGNPPDPPASIHWEIDPTPEGDAA